MYVCTWANLTASAKSRLSCSASASLWRRTSHHDVIGEGRGGEGRGGEGRGREWCNHGQGRRAERGEKPHIHTSLHMPRPLTAELASCRLPPVLVSSCSPPLISSLPPPLAVDVPPTPHVYTHTGTRQHCPSHHPQLTPYSLLSSTSCFLFLSSSSF